MNLRKDLNEASLDESIKMLERNLDLLKKHGRKKNALIVAKKLRELKTKRRKLGIQRKAKTFRRKRHHVK